MKQAIKTKIVELPTFEQLTKDEQAKVLENYADINVEDSHWYDSVYQDAEEIGCKITEHNLEGIGRIGFELTEDAETVAKKIIENHGDKCDSDKLAKVFLAEVKAFSPDTYYLEEDFQQDLGKYYLKMLKDEYEHLTSEEAIKETIIANDYTFNRETLRIDS